MDKVIYIKMLQASNVVTFYIDKIK